MKSKKFILLGSIALIGLITIITFLLQKEKTVTDGGKISFKCNYSNELFKAEVDESLLYDGKYGDNILTFKAQDGSNNSYISIIATTKKSSEEDLKEFLQSYKDNLSSNYKIVDVSESFFETIVFNNYELFDSNGNIISVYTKAETKNDKTLITTYFAGFETNEKLSTAFKRTYDSITLK